MATADNTNNVAFDSSGMAGSATNLRIYEAANSSSNLFSVAIDSVDVTAQQFLQIAANGISIRLPVGSSGAEETGVRRALNGLLGSSLYVQLYARSEASDSTTVSATGALTTRVSVADWTLADGDGR